MANGNGWTTQAPATRWSSLARGLAKLAAGPLGPTRLAVVLAIASLPVVIVSLPAYVPGPSPFTDITQLERLSPLSAAVLAATIPAILIAALVAGSIGGWVVRRSRPLGSALTCALAWTVAIVVLPIGPALLGLPYGTAYIGMNGTLAITTPGSLVGGLGSGLVLSPFLALPSFVALVLGVVVWARAVREADAGRR